MRLNPCFRLLPLVAITLGASACSSSDSTKDTVIIPEETPDASDEPATEDTGQTNPEAQAEASDAVTEPAPQTVHFEDSAFEACVRKALTKPTGELNTQDLAALTTLQCQDLHLTSIAGIEHATALTDVSLWENQIQDISPLGKLKALVYLQIGFNQIQDLAPLSGLTSLKRLGVSVNKVSSLAPLAGLTALEWLNLDNNKVADAELTHLTGLAKLKWLTLEHNDIQDFSALDALTSAGCDLYGNAAALAAPSNAAGKWDSDDLEAKLGLGGLQVVISPSGQVLPRYRLGNRVHPVHPLFRGTLTAHADRVWYRTGNRRVEVGRTTPNGPQLCQGDHANVCTLSVGRKVGKPLAGSHAKRDPIITLKLELKDVEPVRSHLLDGELPFASNKDLVEFALASPNQMDAGSCLFMANSGAVEILMNQHTPADKITYGGDTDLSERFLMIAPDKVPNSVIPYTLTDTLYAYNELGGSLLDRDYHFAAGYVKELSNGSVAECKKTDEGAYLSLSYNWFDHLPTDWESKLVPTPPAERTSIFIDPKRDDSSQWRVGLFDDDTIEKIKYELRTKKAPVLVIYNHFLYWHTNIIVGYDDAESTGGGCPMVEESIQYFTDNDAAAYAKKIKDRMAALGGCKDTGVFYVRDSIYDGGTEEPLYDYSEGDVKIKKEKYSKRIIKLEYDWAKYLGNHTYTVHRK